MQSGTSLADPARFDQRGKLVAGTDNFIDVNCVFEGDVTLGNNVSIGPNCVIVDSVIGDGVEIKANTVIDSAGVGDHAVIGPFARLRPGTQLAANTKVGNFVETKKAIVGQGSKINHLSYVGDATLGDNVNIGAGTITCNYDGVNKHQTELNDNVFVGSNSTLVAPVTVERGGFVAAGSTVTREVPSDSLAVGRAKQRNIEGWKRPTKQTKDDK
jgi:bifunctional UDP-N-acetylglucosamine pyrophosphorylase/glucosamine-1-phosphate N-acetyltransferase